MPVSRAPHGPPGPLWTDSSSRGAGGEPAERWWRPASGAPPHPRPILTSENRAVKTLDTGRGVNTTHQPPRRRTVPPLGPCVVVRPLVESTHSRAGRRALTRRERLARFAIGSRSYDPSDPVNGSCSTAQPVSLSSAASRQARRRADAARRDVGDRVIRPIVHRLLPGRPGAPRSLRPRVRPRPSRSPAQRREQRGRAQGCTPTSGRRRRTRRRH